MPAHTKSLIRKRNREARHDLVQDRERETTHINHNPGTFKTDPYKILKQRFAWVI